MSTDKFKPGDVKIKTLAISTHTGVIVSLMDMYVELSVFEDMLSPYMTASISIVDGVGILKSAPLLGGEAVIIEFETPTRKSAKYTFFVKSIDDVDMVAPMYTSYSYTLQCISEEAFVNNTKVVSKTYTGTISDMIANILKKDLGSKKDFYYDETKGIQDFVVNYEKPFTAIRKLSKRAVSLQEKSSSFMFYEARDGFYFMTLESIAKLKKDSIGDKVFVNVPMSGAKDVNNPEEFRHLLGMAVSDTPSLVEDIDSGVMNSQIKTFDLLSKSMRTTKFNITDKVKDFTGFNTKGSEAIRLPEKIINKYGSDTSKIYYRVSDGGSKETYIDDMLASKAAYTMLALKSPNLINAHGDSTLSVGDLITVKYAKASGIDGDTKKEERYTSGNHLVIRLRHLIRKTGSGPKFVTAMETVTFFGGSK